jgi:ATP-binding cassette, subfamily B, bacterial PglK
MIQYLSKFLYLVRGKKKNLILMILLFLLISTLEALGIGLVGPFISLATRPQQIEQNQWLNWFYQQSHLNSQNQFLLLLGLIVIIVFYIKSFLSFNAQKSVFEFGYSQQGELASRLMQSYLAAPYTFHLGKNSAALIQNILNETDRFSSGVMMPLLTSISNGVVVLALMLMLIITDPLAVVIILGIMAVSLLLFNLLKDRLIIWGKEASESRTEMIRTINHGLGSFKETRTIGCESYFEKQMEEQTKRYSVSTSLALSFGNLPRFTIEAVLISFLIGFTFLSITTNRQNADNITSVLGIFALASIRLLPAIGNLVSSIGGIRYHAYSVERLYFDLKELENFQLESKLAISAAVPESSILAFNDAIALESVSYRYPNAPNQSLEAISIDIQKGQSIGLIGKSGAGKTTLVDVILGLLEPQQGDIKVDGVSIYKNLRSWQNLVGYVPQSIFLMDDTLANNIAFGIPHELVDRQKLYQAVEAAQLSELVEHLSDGLNTVLGERGVLLSGGQRQRVGIARALYHQREILVFDEATAALDNETESLVTDAIKSLTRLKTTIVIAHRLSTIEHCDRIYVMEKGQIIKSGSYQEVVVENKTLPTSGSH